jgi:hypothetical protein
VLFDVARNVALHVNDFDRNLAGSCWRRLAAVGDLLLSVLTLRGSTRQHTVLVDLL